MTSFVIPQYFSNCIPLILGEGKGPTTFILSNSLVIANTLHLCTKNLTKMFAFIQYSQPGRKLLSMWKDQNHLKSLACSMNILYEYKLFHSG